MFNKSMFLTLHFGPSFKVITIVHNTNADEIIRRKSKFQHTLYELKYMLPQVPKITAYDMYFITQVPPLSDLAPLPAYI